MQFVPDLVFIFGYAALSFIIAFIFTPIGVSLLKKFGFVKQIREVAMDGKETPIFHQFHACKAGTPNGGGVIIWGTVLIVLLLSRLLAWLGVGIHIPFDNENHSILSRSETWLPLFTLVVVGLLGLVDDYLNVKGIGKQKGLGAKAKMIWLIIFAGAGAWWFYDKLGYNSIHIPRIGDFTIGLWYIPLFIFIIVACANAVNITDGLDGLAGGLLALAFTGFTIISFFHPNPSLDMSHMIFLAAFCAVIVGAIGAFLWYNIMPAKLFMGDTGSLALGATLGVIAMLTNSIIPLIIIGLIFFWTVFTSAIQLLSKKFLKRKIFKAAPFHHHLQALGWTEANIVMRMWVLGAMLTVVGVIIALIGSGQ